MALVNAENTEHDGIDLCIVLIAFILFKEFFQDIYLVAGHIQCAWQAEFSLNVVLPIFLTILSTVCMAYHRITVFRAHLSSILIGIIGAVVINDVSLLFNTSVVIKAAGAVTTALIIGSFVAFIKWKRSENWAFSVFALLIFGSILFNLYQMIEEGEMHPASCDGHHQSVQRQASPGF